MRKKHLRIVLIALALILIAFGVSMLFFYSDGEHLSLSEIMILTGAVTELAEREEYAIDSHFSLQSNELALNGSSEIYFYNIDSKTIVANDDLYTCDGKTYTSSGRLISGGGEGARSGEDVPSRSNDSIEAGPEDMEELLLKLLEYYENSVSTCDKVDGVYKYSIHLDGEMTEELILMLVPEIEVLGLTYNSGYLALSVEDGKLKDISVEVDAKLNVFISTIPATLTVELDFEAISDVPPLPDAVREAIFAQ